MKPFISCLLAYLVAVTLSAGYAAEGTPDMILELKAGLIWAGNEPNPPTPEFRPVDPDFAKKLQRFGWKHYFTMGTMQTLPLTGEKKHRIGLAFFWEIECQKRSEEIEFTAYSSRKVTKKTSFVLAEPDYSFLDTLDGEKQKDSGWLIHIKPDWPGERRHLPATRESTNGTPNGSRVEPSTKKLQK